MKKILDIGLQIKQLFPKKIKCKVCGGKYIESLDLCMWCNSAVDEKVIGRWDAQLLEYMRSRCEVILTTSRIIAKSAERFSGEVFSGLLIDYLSKRPIVNISVDEILEMSIFTNNIKVFNKQLHELKNKSIRIVMKDGREYIFKEYFNEFATELYESVSKIQNDGIV